MPKQTTLPEASEVIEQPVLTDRREVLAAAFDSAETETAEQRARDEAGRFAPKQEAPAPTAAPIEAAPEPAKPTLTTWKKEYLPLHEKLAQGLPLTADEAKKLAGYNQQRESEYSTGVSVFKERATRLEGIEKAIEPFMPELQRHNIPADRWIANLGQAHQTLALGTPQQKLQMFQKLAQDYGIPLGAIPQQGGSIDPAVAGLMEQIQQLSGQVKDVTGWREQQEQQRVTSAIEAFAKDVEKHPHFEQVKGTMAQLLESGLAPDLETAYTKAIRMDDEVWNAEQARQSQAAQAQNTSRQVVAKAKAAAVSPRSATPSGAVAGVNAKDRRAVLSEQFDAITGRV